MRARSPRAQLSRRGVAFALALAVGACSGDATESQTIPPQDTTAVAAGAELFAAHCAACHGSDLRGTDNGPSLLSEVYEPGHHPDGAFLVAVQIGVRQHHWRFGNMPAIPELDEKAIEAIVAYVRDNQRRLGFEPYRP